MQNKSVMDNVETTQANRQDVITEGANIPAMPPVVGRKPQASPDSSAGSAGQGASNIQSGATNSGSNNKQDK